jgi:hypothetical protein
MVFSAALHDVTLIREILANAFLGVGFALTFPNRLRRYANLHVVIATLGYTIFFAAINTLEPTPYIFLANVVLLVVYPYLFISGDLDGDACVHVAREYLRRRIVACVIMNDMDEVRISLGLHRAHRLVQEFSAVVDRSHDCHQRPPTIHVERHWPESHADVTSSSPISVPTVSMVGWVQAFKNQVAGSWKTPKRLSSRGCRR